MDCENNLLTADNITYIGKCGLSLGIWACFIQEKTGFVSIQQVFLLFGVAKTYLFN